MPHATSIPADNTAGLPTRAELHTRKRMAEVELAEKLASAELYVQLVGIKVKAARERLQAERQHDNTASDDIAQVQLLRYSQDISKLDSIADNLKTMLELLA